MPIYLINGSKETVRFQQDADSALAYPSLPGSRVLSFGNDAVKLLRRELVSELFIIRYNKFRFFKNQTIKSESTRTGMHSRAMLYNEVHSTIEGFGNLHQEQNSVIMFWSARPECTTLFEKGQEYRILDLFFSPYLIEPLSGFFPDLTNPSALHPSHLSRLTPALLHVIDEILDCPYDESTSRFYFELKVREYLFVLLEQLNPRIEKYKFTPYEKDCIMKVKDALMSDLSQPPVSMRELARKAGINEFKLRVGFQHFFGMGVFEYYKKARMEKAKELLLVTNRPIKDICRLTGYTRTTNFITAFRNYFGQTPGSLRRD